MNNTSFLDAPTADTVESILHGLPQLESVLAAHEAELSSGTPLARLVGTSRETLDSLHAGACTLLEAGNAVHALPMAMQLVAHDHTDPRYLFLGGVCARGAGEHAVAATLFGAAFLADSSRADACFLMAECMEAAGQPEAALDGYRQAIEAARADPGSAGLQQQAEAAEERLRQLL